MLKTDTELGLSFAGGLHAVGAPILNPWPAAMMMKDKIRGDAPADGGGRPGAGDLGDLLPAAGPRACSRRGPW